MLHLGLFTDTNINPISPPTYRGLSDAVSLFPGCREVQLSIWAQVSDWL